jgi:hypothetical protein
MDEKDSPRQSKGHLEQSLEREPPQEEDAKPEEAHPHLRHGQKGKGLIEKPHREDQYRKTAGRRIVNLSSGSDDQHPLTFRDNGKDKEVDYEDSDRELTILQKLQLTEAIN